MNTYNSIDRWSRIKKTLAWTTSILLWFISIIFSFDGFNLNTNHTMAWAGLVMAFAITVLELIFNTNSWDALMDSKRAFGEWMLVIGGALAYIYDVWTNILGILAVQGHGMPTLGNIDIGIIIPILVGIFMAILPEPMFVWAMGIKSDTVAKAPNMGFNARRVPRETSMSLDEYIKKER